MSGEPRKLLLAESLLENKVQIELLAEKKGFLKKHAEYLVTTSGYGTQVSRRYSDFLALHELLTLRYPYRIQPRLPPQALTALVAGTDSEFADVRKRSLVRWINILANHPVVSKDPIVELFLTQNGENAGLRLKEEYKIYLDEFVDSEYGIRAVADLNTKPDLKKQIEAARVQIQNFSVIVSKFVQVSGQAVDRMKKANQDFEDWSKDLGTFPPIPIVGDYSPTSWGPLLSIQHNLQLGFSTLSTQYSEDSKSLTDASLETAKIVQDSLAGYKELCDHVFSDKHLVSDHKRSLDRMSLVKKKSKLQGTYLAHDMKEFSRIEAHLEKNHYELSDLDSRRAFSILCLEQETKMILSIAELLGESIHQFSQVQRSSSEKTLFIYRELSSASKTLSRKRVKS